MEAVHVSVVCRAVVVQRALTLYRPWCFVVAPVCYIQVQLPALMRNLLSRAASSVSFCMLLLQGNTSSGLTAFETYREHS